MLETACPSLVGWIREVFADDKCVMDISRAHGCHVFDLCGIRRALLYRRQRAGSRLKWGKALFRKVTEIDHDAIFPFLACRPAKNLFILGDIEAFGYETAFQEVWAYFDSNGRVRTVLLRYYGTYVLSTESGEGFDDVLRILSANTAWTVLQGSYEDLVDFQKAVDYSPSKIRSFYFAERSPGTPRPHIDTSDVKAATMDEIEPLFRLRRSIKEFESSATTRESLRQSFEANTGIHYYIADEQGRMLASASTAAENSISAMVVGVCTNPQYRRQGLATRCLSALCDTYDERGKTLCLFYDNPEAGRIYHRLGFHDIDKWTQFYR